ASPARRRRRRRCRARSIGGWPAERSRERALARRARRGGARLDPARADPAALGRGCPRPPARAAARSCELREEGRLERARPDVRLRRGYPAGAGAGAPGARGAAAFRAGGESHERARGPLRAPAPRPLRAAAAPRAAQRRSRAQARSAARRRPDRGALGRAFPVARGARAGAARAAVPGAGSLRGATLRGVHRTCVRRRPGRMALAARGARGARGGAGDNPRSHAAFPLRAAAFAVIPTRQLVTMSERPHLLIVDDDRQIRGLLGQYLDKHDFRTTAVADGKEMRRVMERSHVDLLVLDLMLPGEDGLSLCRELRSRSQVPIIMLTARGEDVDRIVGLELGADDYLGKPFNPRELLGRIKAILRRAAHAPRDPSPESVRGFCFGGWRLDTVTRTLTDAAGRVVALSGAEYRLLAVLLGAGNRVLSRTQLTELLRGRDADPFDRSIDVRVSRLRQLLGDDARAPHIIK